MHQTYTGIQLGAEFDWSAVVGSLRSERLQTAVWIFMCKENELPPTNEKGRMKTKSSHFDRLVGRYYPTVHSFAASLTDDPREAVALTRDAFNGARKQVRSRRNQTAIATVLISAVLRAGLGTV